MSAEEFWHGDCRLARAYQRAHNLRRERVYRDEWRAGYYVHCATVAASPFNKEGFKYPEAPLFGELSGGAASTSIEERERATLGHVRAMVTRANAALERRETEEARDA